MLIGFLRPAFDSQTSDPRSLQVRHTRIRMNGCAPAVSRPPRCCLLRRHRHPCSTRCIPPCTKSRPPGTTAFKFSQLMRGICSGQCSPNCPPPRRHASRKVVAGHGASVIRIPTNGATTASASASATALLLPVHNNPCRCDPASPSGGRAEGIAPSTGEGSRSQKVRVHLQIAGAAPHTSDPADLPVSTPHHEPLWPLLTPPRRDPPTACAHLRCTPTDQLQIT